MPIRVYRYVFQETLLPFLGAFIFFMFVFLMFQVVRLADYFINHGLSLLIIGKMTVYISAAFLPVVLPISFLMATLVAFGRLSSDSEVVAFKASGVSLKDLYVPIAIFSAGVTAALFYLTFSYIPWGTRELKKTLIKMGNTKVVSTLKEGTFTEGFFDLLVYADKVDAKNNKMTGVFIYDGRDAKNPMAIMSKSGMVIPLKSDSELGSAAILKLNEGSIHRSDIAQNSYEKISFDEYRLMLKVEEGATGEVAHAKTLSAPELLSQMDKYKADYGRYQEYAVELWKRSALSLAPILFGLLGVGLGVVRMRSVKSNALFVAFGVVIVYWGLHVVGQSLGEKGLLPPILAMQIPNLAVLPVAVLSFKRSSW